MNVELVSIVALVGWLVLALSAYRSHRVSGRKMLTQLLVWASIFLVVILVFRAIGG